jgi:hypothetical protein
MSAQSQFPEPLAGHPSAEGGEDGGPLIEITNEFASVRVRKVQSGAGARLEIFSPRLGHAIRLDAVALESLTWQSMDTFSRFLETPFGPTNRAE